MAWQEATAARRLSCLVRQEVNNQTTSTGTVTLSSLFLTQRTALFAAAFLFVAFASHQIPWPFLSFVRVRLSSLAFVVFFGPATDWATSVWPTVLLG